MKASPRRLGCLPPDPWLCGPLHLSASLAGPWPEPWNPGAQALLHGGAPLVLAAHYFFAGRVSTRANYEGLTISHCFWMCFHTW